MSLLTDLVSYWKLDESSGNAADSVGSNTLTNNGTVTYAAGKINNGAVLNGSSQYFTNASPTGITCATAFSFSIWLNPNDFDASGGIGQRFFWRYIDANTIMMFLTNTDGTVEAKIRKSGVNYNVKTNTTISAATLTMITITWDGTSSLKIYKNTTDVSTAGGDPGYGAVTTVNFVIGRRSTESAGYYDGMLDEMGFWSRALSGSEITQLYNLQYPFSVDVAAPLITITNTLYAPTLTFTNPLTVSALLFNITNTFYAPSLQIGIWSNQSRNNANYTNPTKNTALWTNPNKSNG